MPILGYESEPPNCPELTCFSSTAYLSLSRDGGENYHKKFKMPGETNDYYTFKVGKIRFVVISTEFYYILEGGSSEKVQEQMKWMEKALTEANKPKNRKECPWLIVLGHRPVYCSDSKFGRCPQYSTWVSPESDEIPSTHCAFNLQLREGRPGKYVGLEEVFYKYGVDIYFAGHNHQYERSKPVYKHIVGTLPIVAQSEPSFSSRPLTLLIHT